MLVLCKTIKQNICLFLLKNVSIYDIIRKATVIRYDDAAFLFVPTRGREEVIAMVVTTDMLLVIIAFASLVVAILSTNKKD